MKKLLIAILVVFTLCSCTAVYKNTLPGQRNVSVLLREYNVSLVDPAGDAYCSGTLVAVNHAPHVITAAHCVATKDVEVEVEIRRLSMQTPELRVMATQKHINQLHDLALLELKTEDVLPVASVAFAPASQGDTVWMAGSPYGVKDVITKGIVARLDVPGALGIDRIMLDIKGWFGSSGGGVYNDDGELVGVTSQIMVGANFMLAVQLDEIEDIMGLR